MKSSKILAAAAFSILAAAGGAQAETYDGVHALTSQRARAEVVAEAVLAAHSPNPYAEGASAGVAPALVASTDRARVRAEAVARAHAPNQNLRREGFFNSEVPAAYNKPVLSFTRQASR